VFNRAQGAGARAHDVLRGGQWMICRGPIWRKTSRRTCCSTSGCRTGSTPDDPLTELGRRYYRAFAPASAEDFAFWAGIPLGQSPECAVRSRARCHRARLRLLPPLTRTCSDTRKGPWIRRSQARQRRWRDDPADRGGGRPNRRNVAETFRRYRGRAVRIGRPGRLAAEVADLSRFLDGDFRLA